MVDIKGHLDRFYLDMVINELRLANQNTYQHITYNSILYLDIIAYQKDCTVSYLADILHVAKSSVTLKIKELEKQGLVIKEQSSHDKRVYYLRVNKTLLEEYKAYDHVLYEAAEEIQKKYSAAQLSVLCEVLDTISRHFNKEKGCKKGT